jgi:Holliday junction resolvase
MASVGRGARLKGHNFERDVAKQLTEDVGVEFKRGLGQARNGGSENSDVISESLPWVHIECKRHKKCNIKEAVRQAKDDIQKSGEPRMMIAITKDDREEMLVTMTYEQWVVLFKSHLHSPYLEVKERVNETLQGEIT